MKHIVEQIVFDAECAALYLCLIVSGWLALWVFGLRHLPNIQEAFGFKKPAKPLLSESQSKIESKKQEYRKKMASFGHDLRVD